MDQRTYLYPQHTCLLQPFVTSHGPFSITIALVLLSCFTVWGDWQYNTIHSRLPKQINEKEVLFYTEIAAPWPVNNRDMVVDLLVSQDIKTREVTITANSVPQDAPQKDRIVRVPTSLATWTVVPLSSSLLKVEYFIGIDPGGSVPAWMINMVSAEAPLMSFKTLKDKIHQKKYLNVQVPFIVDY